MHNPLVNIHYAQDLQGKIKVTCWTFIPPFAIATCAHIPQYVNVHQAPCICGNCDSEEKYELTLQMQGS